MKSFIIVIVLLLSGCLMANAQCIETKCPDVNRLYCQADSLEKGLVISKIPEYIRALNKLYSARVAARDCEGGIHIKIIDARIVAVSTKVDSLRRAAEKARNAAERATADAERAKRMAIQENEKAERSAIEAANSARIAERSARIADSSARITEASRLVTLASQFKQDDPTLALQLLKKACDTSYFHSEVAIQELQAVLSKTHPASYYKKKIEDTVAVSSVAVSGNGQQLIIGHNDGTLSSWSAFHQIDEPESKLTSLTDAHKGRILSLATSHDGDLIVSGGVDGVIFIWGDQKVQRTLRTEEVTGAVLSVALSADKHYVVSSYENRSILIWDLHSENKVVKKRTLYSGNALQVCFSPNGRYIGLAGNDETVQVWDWEQNKIVATLEEHRGAVRSVAFSPDGNYIASGGDDKTVRVWKWQYSPVSVVVPVVNGHQQLVLSVAFSPVANILVSASQDNALKVWTLKSDTLRLLRTLQGHQKPVFAAGFFASSPYLYSGSYDHSVRLWNWQQDFVVPDSLLLNTFFPTSAVTVHPIKAGGLGRERIVQGEKIYRLILPANLQKMAGLFFFSHDRRYILAQDNERKIWLWDYTQTSRPVFAIYSDGKEPLSLPLDNSVIKSGLRHRNLYNELMNGQLLPTITKEDRSRYLLITQ